MRRPSAASQESYVTQGLALGVLANGVSHILAGNVEFDLAFSRAWQNFPHRGRFPAVASPTRGDLYYRLMVLAEHHKGLLASWARVGQGWQPYLWNYGWTVDESGQTLAEWTAVEWRYWQALARDFLVDLDGRSRR